LFLLVAAAAAAGGGAVAGAGAVAAAGVWIAWFTRRLTVPLACQFTEFSIFSR